MRFLKYYIFGIVNLSILSANITAIVDGPYDINKNGKTESFVLNDPDFSIKWIEFEGVSKKNHLWRYNNNDLEKYVDIEIFDLNSDGYDDLITLVDLSLSVSEKSWLQVFLGEDNGFKKEPLKLKNFRRDQNFFRPSNFTLLQENPVRLAVALGATVREAMLFELKIEDGILLLSNLEFLQEPNTNNGPGSFHVGNFINNNISYISLISFQKDELRVSTFDIEGKNNFINSSIYAVKDLKRINGSGIKQSSTKSLKKQGVIIPLVSNEAFFLTIINKNPVLFKTKQLKENYYSEIEDSENISIPVILKSRVNFDLLDDVSMIPHSTYNRFEKGVLLPPLYSAEKNLKKNKLNKLTEKNATTLPSQYKEKSYTSLTPTLGDFLKTVKDNKPAAETSSEEISIPSFDNELESMSWADEAGFTKIDLEKYTIKEEERFDSKKPEIPNIDIKMDLKDISNESWTKNLNNGLKKTDIDTDNKINLYYVLAITPAASQRDRFIFDGEIPFGVSVNQVPPTGKPTHFKHGISADLRTLSDGNEYDFAYSLRNARDDSITTLKMVHDMQTNLVYMKRSVLLNGVITDYPDSNSKSYQPEAFDPKLFEFPNYFFEGFPNSLDMDFADKLIRFSFNDEKDSLYNGIYLSTTTPSIPSQSLAVFMEEGKLQAIRGEVEVYPNGNKRITTEYDLVGIVSPKVLFSHLIEEEFSEDLKIKLLQGASLEEPLFGPSGRLPKITRQPRLPDAQPDQPSFEIPIDPKQSSIPDLPDKVSSENEEQNMMEEEKLDTLKLNKIIEPQVPSDSLKLEKIKIPMEDSPPNSEEEQTN
tara:strand:- start:5535 stop:7985 length:2451 start_codon:yes stop_codon:yes gene_type:complete